MNSPHNTTETKTCAACGEDKPLGLFRLNAGKVEGTCKACRNARGRAYKRGIVCSYGAQAGEKYCHSCSTIKSVESFHKCSRYKDGLRTECRSCRKLRSAEHSKTEAGKAAQARANKSDAGKAAKARYRKTSANKESQKRYREKNRPYYTKKQQERRARLLGASGDHTDAEWNAILEACDHSCLRCGSKDNISKDHIQPLARGGSNSKENLQPLCKSCNSSKQDKLMLNWIFDTTGVEETPAIH